MKAIVFDSYGPPEVLRLVETDPPQAKPGQLRVRVVAAAVNPADYKWRQGMFKDIVPLSFPHVLGYDIAGVVDQVGEGVVAFKAGDRVVGMLDPVTKGGYAEYAVISKDAVSAVPDALDLAVAAAIPTAGLTGVQLIEEHIAPGRGQRVLITGACGQVGRFSLYAARRLGVHVVAAVRESQRQLARELGADEVVVLGTDWDGEGFDHVADTVGGSEVAVLCRHLVAGGELKTVATSAIDPTGLAVNPEFIAVHPDAARLELLLTDVTLGLVEIAIAHRLGLSDAATAHRLTEAGGLQGKILLQP